MLDEEIDVHYNKAALLKHLEEFGAETLMFLPHVSTELQDDKEVVLAFLNINAMQLDLASEKFKDHEEVVAFAVAQNKKSLQYASQRLQQKFNL